MGLWVYFSTSCMVSSRLSRSAVRFWRKSCALGRSRSGCTPRGRSGQKGCGDSVLSLQGLAARTLDRRSVRQPDPRPRLHECAGPGAAFRTRPPCSHAGRLERTLLSFYDFPAEHWKHLRTTNIIESSFATIRHRAVRSKGCLYNWPRPRGKKLTPSRWSQPVPQDHPWCKFADEIEVVRPQAQPVAA